MTQGPSPAQVRPAGQTGSGPELIGPGGPSRLGPGHRNRIGPGHENAAQGRHHAGGALELTGVVVLTTGLTTGLTNRTRVFDPRLTGAFDRCLTRVYVGAAVETGHGGGGRGVGPKGILTWSNYRGQKVR